MAPDNSRKRLRISGIVAILALLFFAAVVLFVGIQRKNSVSEQTLLEPVLSEVQLPYLAAVQAEQSPIAIVNGQSIAAAEFNSLYLARAENSPAVTIKEVKKALVLKRQIAGQLIIDTLLAQAAKKNNVTVAEKEVNARMEALKNSFPNPEKYQRHITQFPGGETRLREIASAHILKEKLVRALRVAENGTNTIDPGTINPKTIDPKTIDPKPGLTERNDYLKNALLIQQLKAQATISNLLEERHLVMLRQTQLLGFQERERSLGLPKLTDG